MLDKIRNFFWICSGAAIQILKKFETEYIKFASIGATVFFTGVLASLSGGYAMHYVFGNYWVTIPFAILWGVIIFNLDRYIVSSIIKPPASGKGAFVDFFREIPPAIPRFLLASVIAIAVSNPLELRLFQKEIDNQINEDFEKFKLDYSKNSVYKKEIEKLSKDQLSNKTTTDLNNKQQQIATLEDSYVKEVQGLNGTKKYGYGIAAKTIESTLKKLKFEVDSIQKQYMSNNIGSNLQIKKLENDHVLNFELQLKNKADNLGFLARNMALSKLQESSKMVLATSWFLKLLFLILEISPLLVKLLSPKGPYDYHLEKLSLEEKTKASLVSIEQNTKYFERKQEEAILIERLNANKNQIKIDSRIALLQKVYKYNQERINVINDTSVNAQSKPFFSSQRIKHILDDNSEIAIQKILDTYTDDEWWEEINTELEKLR